MDPTTNMVEAQPVDVTIQVAGILMGMLTKPLSDSEAIFLDNLRNGLEALQSGEQHERRSSSDTISYRGSATPEPPQPSPPTPFTPSNNQEIKSSQEAANRPVQHDAAKRKRGTENGESTPTGPVAKRPRHKNQTRCAKRAQAAAAKVPMTEEERKLAKIAKAEQERQIYSHRTYKPRNRGELDVALDSIGVPLPGAGVPAELSVTEKKPRPSRAKPKQP